MSRQDNVARVRAWWVARAGEGWSANEGARLCAEAIGAPFNSVRGWQREAFAGEIAPWQPGYVPSPAEPVAFPTSHKCPSCEVEARDTETMAQLFGFRRRWVGGAAVLRPQSCCKRCR
jgi:hypothetical protein